MADHDTMRGEPRFPLSMQVRVRLETWEQFEKLYVRNISRGGMFVGMSEPAPPGTQMRVEVDVPGGRCIVLRGQVAHTVSPETARSEGRRPGVGVRFLALEPDERAALESLLEQARGVAADGSSKLPAMPADDDDSEQAVVDALRGLLGELKQQSYFEVLGVPYDASVDDVRRGYLMQVKRWHPSRFAAQPAMIRELVAEIFILVKRAFDDLSDPARLRVLSNRTRPRTPQPVREPSQPGVEPRRAGSSELDFALRLGSEGRYSEARRVLTVALSSDPDNWTLREHYNMLSARAALAERDPEAAMLHFHEALRVNPDNREAVREIRKLVRLRRDARRRVLSRLFDGKSIE